jgi:hypothetical protein
VAGCFTKLQHCEKSTGVRFQGLVTGRSKRHISAMDHWQREANLAPVTGAKKQVAIV